ncbi:MAG: hypothetical protein KC620_17000 [Myxococcales bacterium]|nr:hypothetical protein [Myxococcales bacterium]
MREDAVVTLAVFRPAPVDDVDAVRARIEAHQTKPPPALAGFAQGAAPTDEVHLVAAPVDASLPLDLPSLMAEAGEAAAPLATARSAVFIRAVGDATRAEARLRAAALAADALLAAGDGVVVDLGTRRAFDATAWRARLTAADWPADEVRLGAEQAADGTVTFFTRGMARFGQADLEEAGIAPADARVRFDRFQTMFRRLRAHQLVSPGDAVEGVVLRECTRPPEAIEHQCVAL